jgi:uroporphyrinogen-III synthase
MKVIVARADDSFSQALRDAGIEVTNLELIRTEVLGDLSDLENYIERLDEYDGVFFSSPAAAKVFAEKAGPRLKPVLYALGRRAATVLTDAGFTVRTIAEANTADEMLDGFGDEEFAGKKLLFVRGERSMRTIPDRLAAIARIDETQVYRTVETDVETCDFDPRQDWICFFSPSAVEAFEKRFGAQARVAAIGETTASHARELQFEIGLTASKATNEVFARELIDKLIAAF